MTKHTEQAPTLQHMEVCSVLCGSLDGRGVWGRMDTCICIAESFRCSPEISQHWYTAIPQYKIKSKKKKIHWFSLTKDESQIENK